MSRRVALVDHRVRVGIGGWTFEPWRGAFYPAGLPQREELTFASRALTAIEINATYYRLQSAKSFAGWHGATPEGFMFCVKGSRYVTNRRTLADAGEAVERFMSSGLAELREKLGPIVWQLPTTKAFNDADIEAFLSLLPSRLEGLAVRHALEVRHPSFMCEAYLDIARRHDVATVYADSDDYPSFADRTGSFAYARLMKTESRYKAGYAPKRIDDWSRCAGEWHGGAVPAGLPAIATPASLRATPTDVFIFFISGAKERAPAAAMALIDRLRRPETRHG